MWLPGAFRLSGYLGFDGALRFWPVQVRFSAGACSRGSDESESTEDTKKLQLVTGPTSGAHNPSSL